METLGESWRSACIPVNPKEDLKIKKRSQFFRRPVFIFKHKGRSDYKFSDIQVFISKQFLIFQFVYGILQNFTL